MPPPRVLYLTHRVPFPPDKGDRIRNYHVLRQLAKRARVWLLALADEPITAETKVELNRLCERVTFVPVGGFARKVRAGLSALRGHSLTEGAFHEPALDRTIRTWLGETTFAASLVSASGLAPYLQRHGLATTRRFVDLVDVDSQKWFDFAAAKRGPKRWLYSFEGRRLRALETSLPKWAAGVSLVSVAEAAVYDSFAGPGSATVATNGVDLEYFQPNPAAKTVPACAFVGAMDYLPNVDAAQWFADEVWPTVRGEFPDAQFRIIGRKPTPAVVKLAERPGITVIGQVPDVRPFVESASVVVVPMRLSRGLQNKVLEALALGKAVIASLPALAAIRAVPGKHLLAATTPAEWIDAIRRLFHNEPLRKQLGEAGRQFVEEHHHWDRCLRPLLDAIVPDEEAR